MSAFQLADNVALPERFEYRKAKDVPSPHTNTLAELYGRDSQGRIRIFARQSVKHKFIQVEHIADYPIACEMIRQLSTDKQWRGRILREARQERKEGEKWE